MCSRIERLIRQIDESTALWTPHAVHRRLKVKQSNEPDNHSAPDNHTHYLTIISKYPNNPRPDPHATSFFNPAFDIHLMWVNYWTQCHQNSDFNMYRMSTDHRQQRHQNHSLHANSDTRPYNPAFDLHPTRPTPRMKTMQHHTRCSAATYVPGLAQNKRPP